MALRSLPITHTRSCHLIFRALTSLAVLGMSSFGAQAAEIKSNGVDASGESSFNTGVHWEGGQAPSAGNTYLGQGAFIRTPAAAGNFTFEGDSLRLLFGSLVYKGTTSGGLITVNNLILMRGSIVSNLSGTNLFTVGGNITLDPTSVASDGANAAQFQLTNGNSGFTVSSPISGGGILKINTNAGVTTQFTSGVTLTHANNTYSGGTRIETNAFLIAQADGTLGTGNITLTGGKIKFELGTTNNYIADSASFVISSGLATGAIDLNFVGNDNIAGLSLNGGTSFLGAGTYTATTLNNLYGTEAFTGTGTLTVVPEPSTVVLCSIGLLLILGRLGARRRAQV